MMAQSEGGMAHARCPAKTVPYIGPVYGPAPVPALELRHE